MGTINYMTSDYITLGLKPYNPDDFEDYEVEELKEYGLTVYDEINLYIENDYLNIKNLLEDYSFYYFNVNIEPGYYEGFSIYFESNYPIFYDSYLDKLEALKEVTQLKNFLIACVNYGLLEVYPGWCTGYEDSKTTIKHIREVVRKMREDIKNTPTWLQYKSAVG